MVEAEKIINGAVTFNMVWGGLTAATSLRGSNPAPVLNTVNPFKIYSPLVAFRTT